VRSRLARTGPMFVKTADSGKIVSIVAEATLRGGGRNSPTRIYVIDGVGVHRHKISDLRGSGAGLMLALLLFGPLQYLLIARRKKRIANAGNEGAY
jgi:hypothetical protein